MNYIIKTFDKKYYFEIELDKKNKYKNKKTYESCLKRCSLFILVDKN